MWNTRTVLLWHGLQGIRHEFKVFTRDLDVWDGSGHVIWLCGMGQVTWSGRVGWIRSRDLVVWDGLGHVIWLYGMSRVTWTLVSVPCPVVRGEPQARLPLAPLPKYLLALNCYNFIIWFPLCLINYPVSVF